MGERENHANIVRGELKTSLREVKLICVRRDDLESRLRFTGDVDLSQH